jgi:hypothetical protein
LWWGNLREKDHMEYIGVYEKKILELIFKKSIWRAWTGLIRLRIGTIGGLL